MKENDYISICPKFYGQIKNIINQYNFDKSHLPSDYCHVNFFTHICCDLQDIIQKGNKMTTDPMLEIAKSMNDASRSSSNHGKLFLLRDIIMELDNLDLGVTSKAAIKTFLENKKAKIKEDIKRDSKFPDPFLDKL